MNIYQEKFLKHAIEVKALQFGEFVLKSGRVSPYFFNASAFGRGEVIHSAGQALASIIVESKIKCDGIFGAAYKGIPLVVTTAIAFATHYDLNLPWSFNRKEPKSRGEQGLIVGSLPQGNIIMVDDVITAGTAVKEVLQIMKAYEGVRIAGVATLLDRQEVIQPIIDEHSNLEHDIPIISVLKLEHLIHFISSKKEYMHHCDAMYRYIEQYGNKSIKSYLSNL